MRRAIANFMIHVDEPLTESQMETVADALCNSDCVTSACISASDNHLMMVSYDAGCTTAHDIVSRVRQRGLHAEAIGF